MTEIMVNPRKRYLEERNVSCMKRRRIEVTMNHLKNTISKKRVHTFLNEQSHECKKQRMTTCTCTHVCQEKIRREYEKNTQILLEEQYNLFMHYIKQEFEIPVSECTYIS